MAFATSRTVALTGAVGHLIDVQADVSSGHVATVLVGRPDAALNEARDRCRMAIINSQFEWPSSRRTTMPGRRFSWACCARSWPGSAS